MCRVQRVCIGVMSWTCTSYGRSIRGIWDIWNGKQPNRKPDSEPGRLRVAIMGGPTFPKHEKLQGSTLKGISWLELSGISAMKSNQMYKAN